MTPAILGKLVKNHKGPSPGGVSCKFIKLNDHWGIKIYRTQSTRDKSYRDQEEMSRYCLAPKVGIKFDVDKSYCFVTEVATPLIEGRQDTWTSEQQGEYTTKFYQMENDPFYRAAIRKVCDDMHTFGYSMTDDHVANFGWLRGELVCLDFGGYDS